MISKTSAKMLFVDIETAPSLGYVWGKWDQNVIDFKSDWYVLSFAYKWSHEKKVTVRALVDFPGYKKDVENDRELMQELWKLLDQADIVIAHNGRDFDLPKSNTRFLTHKFPPPSPYKIVDTLQIARRVFKFDSNKLDDLGRYLGIGRKVPHTGFHLWKGCMTGDAESWRLMKKYNAHDVELLEKIYYIMRAWHPTHPNSTHGPITEACPTCSSKNVQRRGFSYTMLRQKQRYQCLSCRHWYFGSAKEVCNDRSNQCV